MGRVRLPARDTNSSGDDDDDDDGAVDALSPSKKVRRRIQQRVTFKKRGKIGTRTVFRYIHGTMIRKKRCVRAGISRVVASTFDQPFESIVVQ